MSRQTFAEWQALTRWIRDPRTTTTSESAGQYSPASCRQEDVKGINAGGDCGDDGLTLP
jgi:hypothetical protein